MPTRIVPLAKLNLVYSRREASHAGHDEASRRVALWGGGIIIILFLWFVVPAFFNWQHVISSYGGKYFVHRIVIPVPAMEQDDPRWTFRLLGPTYETIGQAGCAITSAAMVLSAYGVDTDPDRLNAYLNYHGGYTPDGSVYWEKAAEVAPMAQVEKDYEDLPSYALIDSNLLKGNPVIVRLKLQSGRTHFVVVVGKEGWDYLVRDPARPAGFGVYPLKNLTGRIEALRYYKIVPPHSPVPQLVNPPVPQPVAGQ